MTYLFLTQKSIIRRFGLDRFHFCNNVHLQKIFFFINHIIYREQVDVPNKIHKSMPFYIQYHLSSQKNVL